MVIEAFLFLMRKTQNSPVDNTASPSGHSGSLQNRKRGLPTELNDRSAQPASRISRNSIDHLPQTPTRGPAKLNIPTTPPLLMNPTNILNASPLRHNKPEEAKIEKETVEFFVESTNKDDSLNDPEGKTKCEQ